MLFSYEIILRSYRFEAPRKMSYLILLEFRIMSQIGLFRGIFSEKDAIYSAILNLV